MRDLRNRRSCRGHAGSHTTIATLPACARQWWLLVKPCMCEPLMITPLGHDSHPHFKRPPSQGWSVGCYAIAVNCLERKEAKRKQRRRWWDSLDSERVHNVSEQLDTLPGEGDGLRAAVRWAPGLISGWAAIGSCDRSSPRASCDPCGGGASLVVCSTTFLLQGGVSGGLIEHKTDRSEDRGDKQELHSRQD